MVLASLYPCGTSPLLHYAENNNLRDLKKKKIRYAVILHSVAYSNSSKMNLEIMPLVWVRYMLMPLLDFFHSVLLEMSPV